MKKGRTTSELEHPHLDKDANPDPLSGQPGAHPFGTGLGASSAGAAGAALGGGIGGPVGAVVGAAVGSVVGGLAGKGIAEVINPTEEEAYWREEHPNRDYITPDDPYEDYLPAYRFGWESYSRYPERTFEELEPDLEREWMTYRGERTDLEWERTKHATRDAWNRAKERAERRRHQ